MIPLAKPVITEEDKQAVLDVLNTTQHSLGPKKEEFEEKFVEWLVRTTLT